MPASAELSTISFWFHGVGCTAEFDGYHLNWDWSKDNRTDEFEAWKIWRLTREHSDEFGHWSDLQQLRTGFQELAMQGVIESVPGSSVLFHFVEGH
ncbi:hypothetical protein GCM10008957_56990 [Deinococcus ruber]|uniref:DUF6896 domain-containing protein n=2 Tax=Deinococcus ruber TaxID=1848197 RepID=A0A918FJH6_9DEIO|nr:hypothetical protein GCM10008957_56990 [Deinococcus ruber]